MLFHNLWRFFTMFVANPISQKQSHMNKIILTLVISFFCIAAGHDAAAQRKTKATAAKPVADSRFMDMEFSIPATSPEPVVLIEPRTEKPAPVAISAPAETTTAIETASALQLKYALLLNAEVENVSNLNLFTLIDEWFGTRYRMGGDNKSGIDCSAFTKMLYATLFGFALPRTAREQYDQSQSVTNAELKEGDLLFFNTRGGVSHVGMYLQNGKFVHASSSSGVTISDLSDKYWAARYLGGRRALNASWVIAKP